MKAGDSGRDGVTLEEPLCADGRSGGTLGLCAAFGVSIVGTLAGCMQLVAVAFSPEA